MALSLTGVSVNASEPAPTVVSEQIPDASLVGEEMFRYLFWKVYKAQLFAPNGTYINSEPYALRLTYQRSLSGSKIADRSMEEIATQGDATEAQLAIWLETMMGIFPDVKKGDVIVGVATSEHHTVFYFNGKEIGRVEDSVFTQRFFGIWLDSRTSAPEFRQALLNLPR